VKEENVELPNVVKGEDREYIKFERNDFVHTLSETSWQVYDYRNRTPHVFHFTQNGQSTGKKQIVTPWNNLAYWTDSNVDRLVEKKTVQMTEIDFAIFAVEAFSHWPLMNGLTLINRPPTPDELIPPS
jgi:hypothetical protein